VLLGAALGRLKCFLTQTLKLHLFFLVVLLLFLQYVLFSSVNGLAVSLNFTEWVVIFVALAVFSPLQVNAGV